MSNSISFDKYSTEPGVYLMKNQKGDVIYVGKANNLRQRIKQYFLPGRDDRAMIPYLTAEVAKIDIIVVTTEKEALLLENTLIKKHQPKFNALLKDDKTFISLMINHKHPWPMIQLIRSTGKQKKDGLYFGPYTSTYAARQTFDLMAKVFPLRQCSDQELKRRTRPCLLYGIKRCIAPCVGLCTQEEYQSVVGKAIDFLKGHDKNLVKELKAEMEKASVALEYEKAAALLQTIQQIEHITQGGGIVARLGGKNYDAIALYRQGKEVVLAQLFFQDGNLVGSEHYTFSEIAETDEEICASFLLQYYLQKLPRPQEILLPVELADQEILQEVLEIALLYPQKGDKKAVVALAEKNAKELFAQEKDENDLTDKMLLDLQESLGLLRFPERIECFDTSNIAGSDFVAAMVAFTHGKYDKKRGRLFKIRDIPKGALFINSSLDSGKRGKAAAGRIPDEFMKGAPKGDDYAALRQVIFRRMKRAKEENDLPDLIIVDGGKGQLAEAMAVLKELDIATVDLISIAKEEGKHDKGLTQEKIFRPGHPAPLLLPLHSPLLFLVQRIRDETHRRAIGFHRLRRKKRVVTSLVDEIPGIGPVKRKRLLTHFGSLQRILAASDEALAEVQGITSKDIAQIKAFGQ
jgi:excinuclease ABC subunit C